MRGFTLWTDPVPCPGWLNMAVDEALLERAEAGEWWVRLYAWEPTLSFGRHEPAARRYDAARIAGLGLAVVRRPTGGRAVWHAGELTYAVAAPAEPFGSLRNAYHTIHIVLRDALRGLGVPAQLAPSRRAAAVDAGACFASPAGGEVIVAGRKVVGSAQLRRGRAFLQHGSILLRDDQAVLGPLTLGTAPEDLSMPLERAMHRPVGWEEVAAAVAGAAERSWGRAAAPEPECLAAIRTRAAALSRRFQSPEWTWSGAADGTALPC